MSGKSNIQWTAGDDGVAGYTWNPVVGCTRVSAGCDHCYAFQLHDQRHVAWKRGRWPSAPEQYHQPFSRVQLLSDRLSAPAHWRTPRRVFVNSMSDLFHPDVPDEFIYAVFVVMRGLPQHTFQVLTKRPGRMHQFVTETWPKHAALYDGWLSGLPRNTALVAPNIWLGVSVENQAAADERIPLLLDTPAAVRFLSCEPLLGHVSLLPWMSDSPDHAEYNLRAYGRSQPLSWVILGGESGPHARAMELGWALSLREQCRAAGVPFFAKQLGSVMAKRLGLRDRHGGDTLEWPPELMVSLYGREWPVVKAG